MTNHPSVPGTALVLARKASCPRKGQHRDCRSPLLPCASGSGSTSCLVMSFLLNKPSFLRMAWHSEAGEVCHVPPPGAQARGEAGQLTDQPQAVRRGLAQEELGVQRWGAGTSLSGSAHSQECCGQGSGSPLGLSLTGHWVPLFLGHTWPSLPGAPVTGALPALCSCDLAQVLPLSGPQFPGLSNKVQVFQL